MKEEPTNSDMPDLLFFFSDQHHGLYSGYAGHDLIQTPNLDRIARQGTVFQTAYTSCPLCVPARSSMLTGHLPSHNGVFNNSHFLPSDYSTFLHALADRGYETVLCGRMHFKGPDQRHGFHKRICGDITAPYSPGIAAGRFKNTFNMRGCLDLLGAGDSPVLEYDRAVTRAAIDYLSRDHNKPQCIVVGTYGPHFSYVAPPDFFRLYHKKLSPPRSWQPETHDPNPLVDAKCQRTRVSFADNREEPVTTGIMLAARAAYYGMITEQDRLIGLVRDSWQAYLDRNRRQGVFVYSSDHGDTCGEHNLFGKQTFYEGSARIPLVFEGAGIRADHRIYGPVSIMDIGPTLCELAGSPPPPAQDGVSLAAHLQSGTDPDDRAVLCEWVQNFQEQPIPARMIRRNKWKLMHYHHESIPDRLFDIESDPDELYDCKGANPEIADAMLTSLQTDWKPQRVAQRFAEKQRHLSLVRRWYREIAPGEPPAELHRVPESCTRPPEIVV